MISKRFCNILQYAAINGNNTNLVRRVMKTTRPHWEEINKNSSIYKFKWAPTTARIN